MEDEVVPTRDIYGCWGGCYNHCFLLQKNSDNDKTYQCYYNCLNNCTPSTSTSSTSSSPSNFGSLCQGGCFLMICIPLSFGGANIGNCLASCGNLCKFFNTFTNTKLND
ncbi:hypothetical protein KY284_033226 [Solanum tuberosum]|nr:hypothetical protein KY284_033226 [Solanum tuberosum]